MESILIRSIFIIVLTRGIIAAAWPIGVAAFRERMGFGNSLWSGGYFYSTPRRTRLTGSALVLASIVVLLATIG